MAQDKATALGLIDARQGEYIELCSRLIQIPSENPPGDTTELTRFICSYLDERAVDYRIYEPRSGNPMIVASIGSERGPHLVLNGHLDVFPADDPVLWSSAPFSGEVEGGQLKGRGAADMKGGSTASLITFLLLRELRLDLPGRLSLTLVSDEETGGTWGARWLLDNHPEFVGDGLLNAEPTGLDTVWIGEKGNAGLRLISEGEAGHGSLGRGENAITRLAEAVLLTRHVAEIAGEPPADVAPVLEAQARKVAFDGTSPLGDLLTHCSVNVGTIQGGLKLNIIPRYAEAEVDIRIPLGVSPEQVRQTVQRLVQERGLDSVRVEPLTGWPYGATVVELDDPLLAMLRTNALEITGIEPELALCPGATDARFWRSRGVSTVIYGPTSHRMAEPDEYIDISDFLATTKVHTATAIDFFSAAS